MNHGMDLKRADEPLLSELGDDPDFRDLIDMFVEELPSRVEAVEKACEENDLMSLARLAHQLKGAAGGYGFPSITKAAAELEHSIKTQSQMDRLEEAVLELTDLCLRARTCDAPAPRDS